MRKMLSSILAASIMITPCLPCISANALETAVITDVSADKFCFEIENDENICGLEVGNELGLMLLGVSDDETVEYTLSDEKFGKIIYADNTQVTIQLLEAGEAILTAKSSKGNTASVTIVASPTMTEPVPLEPDVKNELRFNIEGDTDVSSVGLLENIQLLGATADETIEYKVSDEKIGKITYTDNTQVVIDLLEAGELVITATSSNGNTATMTLIVEPNVTEPTPLEPDVKNELRFKIEGDTDVSSVGLLENIQLLGATADETIEYKVSDEKIGKITYADNTQVIVELLEAGKLVITATSSNGNTATMNLIVEPTETEPVPLEPNVSAEKFCFEIENDENICGLEVGNELGLMLLGVSDDETVEYTLSDEKIGKIIYADNTQVTIQLLEAGEAILTAKSSKGNTASVTIVARPTVTEPVLCKMGDVNNDGDFNVADVVTFQKWLLGTTDIEITDWKVADFCEDYRLDVYDLCLMKRELVK